MSEKDYKGLRKLRKQQLDKNPTFHCDNCKCNRYSPCTCAQKGGSREERFTNSPVK